jgi:hypothetical protein
MFMRIGLPIMLVFFGSHGIVTNFFPITPSDDAIHIHIYTLLPFGVFSVLTGGYEVPFDDIENVELLPYSSRQLSNMIDGLSVPPIARGNRSQIFSGYRGSYRLFVYTGPTVATPTLYISRYQGRSIVINSAGGWVVYNMYETVVDAWGG